MNDFGQWQKAKWDRAKSFTVVEHDELDEHYWESYDIMRGLDKTTARSIVRALNKRAPEEIWYSVGLVF